MSAWRHYVSLYLSGRVVTLLPCSASEAAVSDGVYNSTAGSWAGYVANGHAYTEVEAQWTVPNSTGQGPAYSSYWVGIGLGNYQTYPLVQGGEESPASSPAYAWVETYYPNDPQGEQKVPGFSGIQGHSLYVHIRFGADGTVATHFIDYTAGHDATPVPQHYAGMKPDGHAEWITESPYNPTGDLANFGTVTFVAADAAAAGWKSLGSLNPSSFILVNALSGHQLAHPGPITPDGYVFTNYFDHAY